MACTIGGGIPVNRHGAMEASTTGISLVALHAHMARRGKDSPLRRQRLTDLMGDVNPLQERPKLCWTLGRCALPQVDLSTGNTKGRSLDPKAKS